MLFTGYIAGAGSFFSEQLELMIISSPDGRVRTITLAAGAGISQMQSSALHERVKAISITILKKGGEINRRRLLLRYSARNEAKPVQGTGNITRDHAHLARGKRILYYCRDSGLGSQHAGRSRLPIAPARNSTHNLSRWFPCIPVLTDSIQAWAIVRRGRISSMISGGSNYHRVSPYDKPGKSCSLAGSLCISFVLLATRACVGRESLEVESPDWATRSTRVTRFYKRLRR